MYLIPAVRDLGVQKIFPLPSMQMVDNVTTASFLILSDLSFTTYPTNGQRSGDRIPVVTRFSAHIQTGPGAYPASCTMGTGSFPGVKAAGA